MHWTVCPLSHTEAPPSMKFSVIPRRFLRRDGFGGMQLMWSLSHSEDVLSNVVCWKKETAL